MVHDEPEAPEEPDYQALEFEYQRSPEQAANTPVMHPVVVVGAGPVGLSLAIDLAQRGQPVLLLDNDHRLSSGSCTSKTLQPSRDFHISTSRCAVQMRGSRCAVASS